MNSTKKKITESLLTVGLLFTTGCGGSAPQTTGITVLSNIEQPGIGETVQFSVKVAPEGASSKVTWSVSDSTYMTINVDSGEAKALKAGSVTVTATATDGSGIKGNKTLTIVDKTPKVTSITVSSNPDKASVGESVQFSATVLPEGASKKVTWSVSDASYLAINKDTGAAQAVQEGTVDVIATATDGSGVTGKKTFVISGVITGLEISSFEKPLSQQTFIINTSSSNMDLVGDIDKITRTSSDSYMSSHFFYNDDTKKNVDSYKVGAANPFQYLGKAVWYDSDLNRHELDATQEFELWIHNGTEYVKLSDNDVQTYLDTTKLDSKKSSFQFKDAAIGKSFRLITKPSKSIFKYSADLKNQIDFDVIEGYNVYNFADLTTFDNWNTAKLKEYCSENQITLPADYMGGVWDEFKKTNNIPDKQFNKVVLHNNISISSDDLPKYLVWSEHELETYIHNNSDRWTAFVNAKKLIHPDEKDIDAFCRNLMIGSLKDRVGIFTRYVKANETFSFEGNYFTIDASKVKPVVCFDDKTLDEYQSSDGSHSQLFAVCGDPGYYEKTSSAGDAVYDCYRPFGPYENLGDVEIKNLQLKGNAPRSGTTDEGAGGLIAFKHVGKDLKLTNVIASEFFTAIMGMMKAPEFTKGVLSKMHVDRCRITDAYSTMFYFWGETENHLTNSFCKNAGGAIMICDETFDVNETTQTVDNKHTPVTETTNCYFEAFVTGQEPWFKSKTGASFLVSVLTQIGAGTNGLYTTYKDKDYTPENQKRSFGKLDGTTPKVNIVALTLSAANFINYLDKGDLTLSFTNNGQKVIDLAMANDPTSIISTYKNLAHSGESPAQLFAMQSSKGGHSMLYDKDGTNALMFDTGLASVLPSKSPAIDFASYAGNDTQRQTIDQLTDICKNNLSNFFSGDYCALYLEPVLQANLIGALLGYK